MKHVTIKAKSKPKSRNLYNRTCVLRERDTIKLTHIGGDYIGLEVNGEYVEVGGYAQHIIWELMRRLGL